MDKKYLALVAVAGLSAASCGKIVDSVAERAVEEGIEQAIEADSGEHVDIDLSTKDGKISITGEDGEEIEFDANEKDGTLTITETDDEGNEQTINVTSEGEDGNVTIETDDGSFYAGEELPDDWPAEWTFPPAVTVVQAGRFAEGDSVTFQATFTGGDIDAIKDHYSNLSVGQDISAESQTTSDGTTSVYLAWSNDSTDASFMNATDDGTDTTGTVFITIEG